MTYVQFVLVCEGGADTPLVEHLEKLLIRVGALEVMSSAPDFARLRGHQGHDVQSKLETALALHPGSNLIVIHRDSDSPDPGPRYGEIEDAIDELGVEREAVAVVPVQETEAWLLLDEDEIKRAAGNPDSSADLDLPAPHEVEDVADPKQRLHEALLEANGATGQRRDRVRRRLPSMVAQLLRRLPVYGTIEEVTAWQRLREDLDDAIEYL